MTERQDTFLYTGDGIKRWEAPPLYDKLDRDKAPDRYVAESGLRDAVNVALLLGQPLLVTGEPGTGKTQLAFSIAHELGAPPPLVFNTKSTSVAKDLFYRYDALGHFHETQVKGKDARPIDHFIEYTALGLAILLSKHPGDPQRAGVNAYLSPRLREVGPVRSVVLVDEVDKAPRDLPNDILNEIDEMSFRVTETGLEFNTGEEFRPILVLTSNSEKGLPDAFLRRCAFYHIPFPEDETRLLMLIERRLDPAGGLTRVMREHAVKHFLEIRKLLPEKKPATAELLAWLRILELRQLDVDTAAPEAVIATYSALGKTEDDLAKLRTRYAM